MDPDATLAQLRAAIRAYAEAQQSSATEAADEAAAEAIGAMVALDSWLSMGGFLPASWHAKRNGLPESRQA